MDECSLPKARPILCNESPAFQRHHMSLFCAAESPNRFPWVINTTFGEKTYIRWCCNDRLSSQRLSGTCQGQDAEQIHQITGNSDRRDKRREALGNLTSASSTAST